MTRKADWHVPRGLLTSPPLLALAPTIMARSDSGYAILDQAEIARLRGCSGSVAPQRVPTLAELSYLTKVSNSAYQLAGGESDQVDAEHHENGMLDATAQGRHKATAV